MSPARIVLHAPAKLNLTLAVGARRADGYHELDSILFGIGWSDVLAVERRDAGCSLEVRGPASAGVPADDTNLALRAARAVLERGGAPHGLHLVLEKHVPAAAGLGGGSSDAAAALFACARLTGLDPDDASLRQVLEGLGSDCPFFLGARRTGIARCTGRGERVEPLGAVDWPWSVLVVTPTFGCETAAVYRALAAQPRESTEPAPDPGRLLGARSLDALRASLQNDLEEAAVRAVPALGGFRSHLESCAPGAFHLAGSGSSWFAFFPDDASAREVLARVESANGGRRYALRARWLGPASSAGLERRDSKSQ